MISAYCGVGNRSDANDLLESSPDIFHIIFVTAGVLKEAPKNTADISLDKTMKTN